MLCKEEKKTTEDDTCLVLIISYSHAVYAVYIGGGVY